MLTRKPALAFLLVVMGSACAMVSPASADSSSGATDNPSSSRREMAPEFGPSVIFDRGDAPIQLMDLRGKMVVLMFFQSWCPVCNGWSPELIQQMQQTFGDDPAVALVAIKVDGGTPGEAKAYLRSKQADLSKWIVASDTGGLYYQRVSGTDALWGYALVGADGRLIERGHAGSFMSAAGGRQFVLADADLKKKDPDAAPIVAVDESMPPELKAIARVSNSGHLAIALRALKSLEHGKLKESAEKMQTTLLDALTARVDKAAAALKSDDAEARYDGYRMLSAYAQLSNIPAGQAAKTALASLKTDKALAKELANDQRAESAFWSMLARAQRLEPPQRQANMPAALQNFANAYTGTSYSQRALAEAQTIATGKLAAQ